MVIRHPLLEVPNHGVLRLLVQLDVVRVDSVHLGPTLSTRVLQSGIHVHEGLIDLLGHKLGNVEVCIVEASCITISNLTQIDEHGDVISIYLDRRSESGPRLGRQMSTSGSFYWLRRSLYRRIVSWMPL